MDSLLKDLLTSLNATSREIDQQRVIKAWNFAALAHEDQKRFSGEPYIIHPTQVAKTLALWNLDTTSIVAGLLHDTVEDGGATAQDIEKEFGHEVSALVKGVTKITKVHLTGSDEEEFVDNLRNMLLVMARDLRVVLVKLADRLHNMQTLQYLKPQDQLSNSKETLEIYAPLADRLGMGEIKGQLEDLAFPFVFPAEYRKLISQTHDLFLEGEKYIEKFRRQLLVLFRPQLPRVAVNTRQKHLYSLYCKLKRPEIGGDLTKIYDLVAARILVDSPEECYLALGVIHGRYHPVPYLHIDDFIANPKPNGYQSIHTKVFGPQGRVIEIQIRTHHMHDQAEYGIAAHWQYAQAKSHGATDTQLKSGQVFALTDKLGWVKQLAAWQHQIVDNDEYLDALKFDALAHRNLVFSPRGDVFDLPRGATPIDYAYAVHTDLGHQTHGAKVNGKLVPLSHVLVNGDVVELLIDRKRKTPSHEWLGFVVTTTARHQIQKALKA